MLTKLYDFSPPSLLRLCGAYSAIFTPEINDNLGSVDGALPYEMHGLPGFVGGTGDGVAAFEVLEKPRHVAAERTHRLHSLGVALALALVAPEHDVPVLRRDDWAVQHLKGHVHALKRSCRTAAPAHRDGGGRFGFDMRPTRKADTLPHGEECAVGLAVVGGRTYHERIGRRKLPDDAVGDVVIEDAASERLLDALVASAAAANRLLADPDGLGFDSLGSKGVGDFLERPRRVAVFTRASVDEQYFHFVPFCLTRRCGDAEGYCCEGLRPV